MPKAFEEIIDSLNAQLPLIKQKQRELAKYHIKDALKCVDINELIEIAHDIYGEEFAKGENQSAGQFN